MRAGRDTRKPSTSYILLFRPLLKIREAALLVLHELELCSRLVNKVVGKEVLDLTGSRLARLLSYPPSGSQSGLDKDNDSFLEPL